MFNKKRVKKVQAFVLAAAVAVGCLSGTPVTDTWAAEQTNVFTDLNPGFDGAAENGVPWWWYASSAAIAVVDDADAQAGKCVKVVPESAGEWVGCATNATSALKDGVTYGYAFYAKLGEESSAQTKVMPVLNRVFATEPWDSEIDTNCVTQEDVTLDTDTWTKVSGVFTVSYASEDASKTAKELHFVLSGDSTDSFFVDDLQVWEESDAQYADTIVESDFEDGTTGGWYASTANSDTCILDVVAGVGIAYEGSSCVKISDRTDSWNCIAMDITDRVKNNTDYEFSFWVKLDEEYGDAQPTVQLCTTKKDSEDESELYDKVSVTGGRVTASKDEWRQVTGTMKVTYSGTLEKLEFKVAEQGEALTDGHWGGFYLDNVLITEKKSEPIEIQQDIPSLKDIVSERLGGATTGVCITPETLKDEARMALVTKHFNSITCENQMKPDFFFNWEVKFKTDENGNEVTTESGDKILQLNFAQADAVMDGILAYNEDHSDAKIGVRGHVLVWDAQTPDFFFHENYDVDQPFVSKEVMLERLENYVKDVMEHYDGNDSKYKGMIYAWDVVNEQIEPGDYNAQTNPLALRVYRNGEETNWHHVFGGSEEYITQAFVLANKYAPDTIKLFYNDYGETDSTKSAQIAELLKIIKDTDGARIDGMGMQAHYDMVNPSVSVFEAAVRAYAAVVDEIQITELDIASSNDYTGVDKAAEYTKQAYRYKSIFETLCRLENEDGINITSFTIWGTDDGHTWLADASSVGGGQDGKRPQVPLLFDEHYQAKPAYWGIVDSSKLEPNINTISARYAADGGFEEIDRMTFEGSDGNHSFVVLWNTNGLKVLVNVSDETVDEQDRVVIYVNDPKNAFTVRRSDASVMEGGYQAVVEIPADVIGEMAVCKEILFDVAVFNGTQQSSWNDLTNNQENDSKYYGKLVCKPYTEIVRGTAVVDGTCGAEWEKAQELPLTIQSGTPNAKSTVRLMWDDQYLYAFFMVKDEDVSDAASNPWEQDSVEVFVDENNGKTDSYEDDDCQYRVNFKNEASFNGKNCNAQNLKSVAKQTEDGYIVELAVKWAGKAPVSGNMIGVEFQINDGTSAGTRCGTVSWYDQSGMGYAQPAVFGTAKLVGNSSSSNNGSWNSGIGSSSSSGTSSVRPEDTGKTPDVPADAGTNEEKKPKKQNNVLAGKDAKTGLIVRVNTTADGKAAIVAIRKNDSKTITVPKTVTVDGVKYTVTRISSGAFKNASKATRIILPSTVNAIGERAFAGASKVKRIDITSTKTVKVSRKAFKGMKTKNVMITVKVSKKGMPVKAFKEFGKALKSAGFKGTVKKITR